ncbi:MAG: response regulator [Prochloraceae cyanobacterium]|nr:response regulator [Prochloraceae cyanobacterium]
MPTQKILVIDDSRFIRMHVRDMLPEGDYEVLEARDGKEGLDLILKENPNLIMLDFLMPKMSGWEVYQEILSNHELQAIPLLVMSGRKEEVMEKIPEPFEHFAFVEKPFEQEELLAGIKDAVKKSKKRSGMETSVGGPNVAAMSAEIEKLKGQISEMQTEIGTLKKQLAQVVGFIKQKLR